MKAKTTIDIYNADGETLTVPAGSTGEVLRVIYDDVFGDDLIVEFPKELFSHGLKQALRIPVTDLTLVRDAKIEFATSS